MRRRLAFTITCAAIAAAGCDWTAFDDLRARTPVLAVDAPADYAPAGDFGRIVLPVVPPAGGPAARYVVSAVTEPAVAVIDLDSAGQPSGDAVNATVLSQGGAFPVTSLAEVPGAGQVLMGAPQGGGGRLYLMTTGATTAPAVALFDASTTEDNLGLGVGAANLTGGAAPDLVAVSSASVRVYVAGAVASPLVLVSSTACPLEISADLVSRARVNRAVVTGRLLAGGGAQIAVGTPSAVGPGTVAILAASTGGLTCVLSLSATPNRFGQALATGDFDGDGNVDLLVGAPPHDAYIYKGPITAATTPVQITYADSAGEFGAAVAALNVDGTPGDEALISDSAALVAGVQLAGAVVMFGGAGLATPLGTVSSSEPVDGGAFGASVGALPFCPMGCGAASRRLLLAGGAAQTFTYFLLRPADTDPRRR